MSVIKPYISNRDGATAVLFGLSATALILIVGGGLDFSRAVTARLAIQDSVDAAILRSTNMVSASPVDQQTAADLVFNKNFNAPDVTVISKKLISKTIGNETNFTYTAKAKIGTVFLGMIGINSIDLNVEAKANAKTNKSEIVFVLDSTGSMAGGGKMTNLKSSVDSALASLLDSGGKNVSDTKVGIVPFDVRVRIAKGSGLPHINYNLDPTLCTSSKPTGCNLWDGFVTDRNQSFDVSATTATPSDPSSLYPAVFSASKNLAEVMGLTTDIKAARDSVATFKPAGNTNITIGVQWGMEVLSPDGPYTGGVAFNDPNTKKYMILVTDGDNTQNRWTSSTTSIDNRTKLACEAAKAKGITIFVVRVMNGNSALLKSCASKPEYYYDLSNASQLDKTLKDVFSSLKKARLTQ